MGIGVEAMVGFLATALDYRPFLSEAQVIAFATKATRTARTLMIYDTQLVRTWLVADSSTLWIVSDDKAWENPSLGAAIALDRACPVAVEEAPKPVLRFGSDSKAWPYSRKLFQRVSVKDLIEDFLTEETV
jgi:hypothetical protein